MVITLTLDINEVQVIMNSLMQQPMVNVEAVVIKIRNQVTPQLQPTELVQQPAEEAAAE